MNKKMLVQSIKVELYNKYQKNMINLGEVANFLTIGRNKAREIMYNSVHFVNGKEKLYLLETVAVAIEKNMVKVGWYEFWKRKTKTL